QRLQCLPQFVVDLLSCHATANVHQAPFDDTVLLAALSGFDNLRVMHLQDMARHINAKFESESLLHVGEVRVYGERDEECAVDLAAGMRDPRRAMYLHYGLRIKRSTMRGKDQLLSVEALVERLKAEYADVADLFEAESGISLASYCDGMLELNAALKSRGELSDDACADKKGRIDPEKASTFIAVARGYAFTDAELVEAINPEFLAYLRHHPFDSTAQSDAELKFHYLSRRPFLIGLGVSVLSPDLVYDSLLDNTHFTLLENEASKPAYMARRAVQFIDQIAVAAARAGYKEAARDVYLHAGKKQLGDIDLVLRNKSTGHHLLIEAKNHALPLAVYFRAPEAVDEHVERSRDWERKVERRIQHLKEHSSAYAIEGPWDYIVVTRMPEPLSHLSHLLMLSLDEFSHWVMQEPRPSRFTDIYAKMYRPSEAEVSVDDMRQLHAERLILARPAEE
ncbi:hypothetical protein, partial [Cupriavidus numazuensis]